MHLFTDLKLRRFAPAVLIFISAAGYGAPYDSVGFALRQQAMINDLRTHCRISLQVSDEKIRSTFLADPENHQTLIKAADAMKAGDRVRYSRTLADISCPSML